MTTIEIQLSSTGERWTDTAVSSLVGQCPVLNFPDGTSAPAEVTASRKDEEGRVFCTVHWSAP